ncbi:beta strand repeat-containing protein [Flavobacterium quisquiliarum]|uniref:Beta strand repeat-containing protein n=1 Tax=Flavobacterium quisquiliarum TaxID=1834436 RepID=A0ABV8W1Y7_9FLAO|nr:hypothetical protein [Flavobacterium quisquiliarum]MBW1655404.1 hypothetical protein [Flavobacterium quisquiliarum]NWL03028.1 hypothetical protein [Flavobacterium collinsii]
MGYNALTTSRTGNNNASLGSDAGSLNTQGSQNTFIGTNSNPTGGVFINNATAIGYNSTVAASNSLVLGAIGPDAVKVGIGIDSPSNTLHVKPMVTLNPVRFEGLQPSVSGTDLVVVADNTGVLRTVTPSSLVPTTSVSNTSSTNNLSTTVNGVTGADVTIINSNTLTATNGNLVSTVNGVQTTPAVPVLIAANNGLTSTNGNVQLGGALTIPTTTIATNGSTNSLAISGLPAGAPSDRLVAIDPTSGILKTVTQAMWSTIGNASTNPASNFLGTTDNQPLRLRINNVTAGNIATNNTALGYQALTNTNTGIGGVENTAIGVGTLVSVISGGDNTAVGHNALNRTTSAANTAVGAVSLPINVGGTRNTAVGFLTLTANTIGNYNNAFGVNALHDNISGSYNLAVGSNAGYLGTTGSNNILIGSMASTSDGVNTSALAASNELNIGNTLFGTSVNNNSNIGPYTGRIGINTNVPTATLDINGAARVRSLPAGSPTDNIVTVDGSGNLRTVPPASSITVTMNIVRNTADYTVDPATDNVILIDAASNNVTVTVPSGVAVGRVFTIKRVDSVLANTVTITFAGATAAVNETDTFISVDIKTAYQIITAGSDKWQTISKFQ